MKAKKFIVTSSELNSLAYTELDLTFIDSKGMTYYPVAVSYNNASGATLGFISLESTDEQDEALIYSDYYEYLEIPTGKSVADLPPTKFLRISNLAGSATGSITVIVYNYISWIAR